MLLTSKYKLVRLKLLSLLHELEADNCPAISLYIPPGISKEEITRIPGISSEVKDLLPDITRELTQSKTGAVLFWGEQDKYLVLPPFPVTELSFSNGYSTRMLCSSLERQFTVALILLRLGAYAVGVFRGQELLSSKVGTGLIHSRHRQGGSSQRRFERGREKQIEYFFTRVCNHVNERLQPYLGQLEYIFYGGERYTLLSFHKQCHFLKKVDYLASTRLLDIRKPGQKALEMAIDEVWSSRIIQWEEHVLQDTGE